MPSLNAPNLYIYIYISTNELREDQKHWYIIDLMITEMTHMESGSSHDEQILELDYIF